MGFERMLEVWRLAAAVQRLNRHHAVCLRKGADGLKIFLQFIWKPVSDERAGPDVLQWAIYQLKWKEEPPSRKRCVLFVC